MMVGQIALSNYLFANKDTIFGGEAYHWKVMLYVHIFAWLTQFVGHGIFESNHSILSTNNSNYIGRAPALLDNILLMFVAPFFMIFEVLNMCLGYK